VAAHPAWIGARDRIVAEMSIGGDTGPSLRYDGDGTNQGIRAGGGAVRLALRRIRTTADPRGSMTIGTSLFLIAVGAILKWAVTAHVAGVQIHTVGVILMVVGGVGLAIGLWLLLRGRSADVPPPPPHVPG
jgi:hypothetical protein